MEPLSPPNPIFPEPPNFPDLKPLPPLPDVLKQPRSPSVPPPPPTTPNRIGQTFVVRAFQVSGSTVFSPEQLKAFVEPYLNRPISTADLLALQTEITNQYLERGYITSGAVIPANQGLDQGVILIQILEGQLDQIQVTGTTRLRRNYIRDRIQLGVKTPLNINQLSEALRKLQLNPLIESISSELSASELPGFNRLEVVLDEANSGKVYLSLDNSRSASIGRLQRTVSAVENNLTGIGDSVSLTYSNTDGSNDISGSYTLPVNARDGSINLGFQQSWTRVIDQEVQNQFDITGNSFNVFLGYRQPILSKSTEEVVLGIQGSRIQSQSLLDGVAFPLAGGSDEQGRTRITKLQFYQEWLKRSDRQLFAIRSDFGAGLDIAATQVTDQPGEPVNPDGRFFKWRGQGQWIRRLAGTSQLFVNSTLQFAATALPQIEQLGLGGPEVGRGYPSNVLLADNGVTTSAEVRVPIWRVDNRRGVLQIVPFIDYGLGWNLGERPIQGSNHLLSTGLGLQWQWRDRLSAQVSWGIPIINSAEQGSGFNHSQVFFTVNTNIF